MFLKSDAKLQHEIGKNMINFDKVESFYASEYKSH